MAQISLMPMSTRLPVMSTDASSEVPTPTTAAPKSLAPICSSARGSAASASTTGRRARPPLDQVGVALDGEHLDVHEVERVGERGAEAARAR